MKQELVDPDDSSDDEADAGAASTSGTGGPGPPRAFGPAPNVGAIKNLGFTEALGPDDVPPPPPHPSDPDEIRALMRSKMHRCGECKNRFVEKNLLERHLAARHPDAHAVYMDEQSREMELQRLAELEQVRREEILSGGFIPPADEIEAYLDFTHVDPARFPPPPRTDPIALPLSPPTDSWKWTFAANEQRVERRGSLVLPPRRFAYRKKVAFSVICHNWSPLSQQISICKVSPQCPFCDKRFRNEVSLKKHVAKKHPLFIDFVQCNRCYKCLPSQDDLVRSNSRLPLLPSGGGGLRRRAGTSAS